MDRSLGWSISAPNLYLRVVYANSFGRPSTEGSKTGCNAMQAFIIELSLIDAEALCLVKLLSQGNLSPELMRQPTRRNSVSKKKKKKQTDLLEQMNGDPAHILNLGHGIRPGAKRLNVWNPSWRQREATQTNMDEGLCPLIFLLLGNEQIV